MADRYIVKWSAVSGEWPMRPFSSQKEALDFVKELFEKHGEDGVDVSVLLNDDVLIPYRRLCQWHRGMFDF